MLKVSRYTAVGSQVGNVRRNVPIGAAQRSVKHKTSRRLPFHARNFIKVPMKSYRRGKRREKASAVVLGI